jgi:hypothetical protein
MTATRPSTHATPHAPLSRSVLPLMGWRHPVTTHPDQLTHAVMPGRTVADCGVVIMALGQLWPEPGAGTPLARCSICARAVDGLWTRLGLRADALTYDDETDETP